MIQAEFGLAGIALRTLEVAHINSKSRESWVAGNLVGTPDQVAETCIGAARHIRRFGVTPKVALLSHSVFGSLELTELGMLVLIFGAFGVASLWEAVFADVGVAFLAILNAVRLQRIKF